MTGETNLEQLLATMAPCLGSEEYVFSTMPGHYGDHAALNPLASFQEAEGLTLVVTKSVAEQEGFPIQTTFRPITLTVHSSLQAVGLTAAVSTVLAAHGISANVIAAFYHDHIFVPTQQAEKALEALQELGSKHRALLHSLGQSSSHSSVNPSEKGNTQ